jgi:antitoxin VapB
MPFHVRDPQTDALVRELARERGCGLTEAVRLAVSTELARKKPSFTEQLRALQDEVLSHRPSGHVADKAFYDELWGEED